MNERFNAVLTMDEEDIIMSSPSKRFYDIVYNANKNLVEKEVDELLKRYIALENLLEKEGYDLDTLNHKLDAEILSDAELENKKNSLYIELTGKIVTQNE
jgi:hypothetical protein